MSTEIAAAIITGISTIIAGAIPTLASRRWKFKARYAVIVAAIIAALAAALSYKAAASIAGKYEVYDNGKHVFDSVIYLTGFGTAESFGCGEAYVGSVKGVDTYRRVGWSSRWTRDSDHTSFEMQRNGDLVWFWPGDKTTVWKRLRGPETQAVHP